MFRHRTLHAGFWAPTHPRIPEPPWDELSDKRRPGHRRVFESGPLNTTRCVNIFACTGQYRTASVATSAGSRASPNIDTAELNHFWVRNSTAAPPIRLASSSTWGGGIQHLNQTPRLGTPVSAMIPMVCSPIRFCDFATTKQRKAVGVVEISSRRWYDHSGTASRILKHARAVARQGSIAYAARAVGWTGYFGHTDHQIRRSANGS